jgi:hypothetical protein
MLSLMQNPASPKLVSESVEDHHMASRYRLYVIYRIPALKFLDASPVTPAERSEARSKVLSVHLFPPPVVVAPAFESAPPLLFPKSRESFLKFAVRSRKQTRRPRLQAPPLCLLAVPLPPRCQVRTAVCGIHAPVWRAPVLSGMTVFADADDTPGSAKRKPSSYLGLGTSRYDGRHSEGNRFIMDDDL